MSDLTDLTFFTNEPGATLLDRFKMTLKDTQFFDVLVGYFRTSGFYPLAESLEKLKKIRILVGINIDATTHTLLESTKASKSFDFESHKRTKESYSEGVIQLVQTCEQSAAKFVDEMSVPLISSGFNLIVR